MIFKLYTLFYVHKFYNCLLLTWSWVGKHITIEIKYKCWKENVIEMLAMKINLNFVTLVPITHVAVSKYLVLLKFWSNKSISMVMCILQYNHRNHLHVVITCVAVGNYFTI